MQRVFTFKKSFYLCFIKITNHKKTLKMKNFQKRTLLKMANVNMGLIYMPTVTLTWVVTKAKSTKQANADFLFLLTNKEYVRIFENWGEKNWELAKINATEMMQALRERV